MLVQRWIKETSGPHPGNPPGWNQPFGSRNAIKVAAIMDKFDGVPTLWIGHADPQHAPLRKTGFFEGRLTYNNWWQRTLSGRIKGIV